MPSMLLSVLLLAGVVSGARPESEAEVKAVAVSVTDEKGAPIQGLAREDVALLENGVARDIVSLELDRRPLTLAFLLDTSAAIAGAYRLHVVDAVLEFLRGLPPGSRFALWTTGDRPERRVDFTEELAAADRSLRHVVPQGGSTLLDAILEAAAELKKKEGERSALVMLSATGPEFSGTYRERVVEKAPGSDIVFHSVLVELGATDLENRTRYDFVLAMLASKSGGIFETTLSPMGIDSRLKIVLAALSAQYRLSYATLPDLKERKLEVKVARPGARIRIASASTKK